ncbi:MAG: S8 family serine peptidase [Candidatus Krumholzibacteria bacterium]|nr:S8 family serine peptidase [Candidatus Krumholzibacteria bacterium]
MIAKRLFILLVLLLGAAVARAGTISPGLETLLQDLGEDESIKVLVVLDHQADIAVLDRNLRGSKSALPRRHRLVVESLRAAADASQAGLLAELVAKTNTGQVLGFVPHWLINSVVVTATPSVVREIAARPDVAIVEPDLAVTLISPVPGIKSMSAMADTGGVGVASGVRAVGAPRVWSELGIDGTGTIVGILDTGVDATHPALADRWRGNFAPAAECWLDASGIGDTSFPVDQDPVGHGTHVMGILTGLAPGDTIGVAPGARWIAANTIIGGLGRLDNAVMASLEFMTDPDGDPSTTQDVPDVVSNSWGVSEAFQGYFGCDSRWWEVIENCEAAGVVLVWAAGNEGPYSGSLRSPADRATTPLNCFSVGSTGVVEPYTISDFSSRGPSGCGGAFEIKPEVVAPGEDIYSARPGGVYQLLSGTSMAVPHIAGVVALMRQAKPDLDVTSIKEILMSTALDRGESGQDNSYGHGFIDAYAAVTTALGDVGTVEGTVTDFTSGLPLAGVAVTKIDGYNTVLTDPNGDFSLTMLAGPANFQVSKFGYFDGGFFATIVPDGVSSHAVTLYAKPTATISGHVFGPDDQPVPGATVTPLDIPLDPAVTDTTGYYELALPHGPGLIYELKCWAPGLGYDFQSVELESDQIRDFHLPEQIIEDFESGTLLSLPWTDGGEAPWGVDPDMKFEGAYSARSGAILNDQSSVLSLDYFVSVDSHLQFWSKVSSEYYYDTLKFYLDGDPVASWSGERDWSQFRVLVPRGHHDFTWTYRRDVAFSEGEDAAWLDFIEFPTTGEELFPAISVDVASLAATVAEGDTTSLPFNISNTGDWILDFRIEVGDLLKTSGHDIYGYQWEDSDFPNGPVFNWVDISADGVLAGSGDNENLGPFPLGFSFDYYGAIYPGVGICTNGFLSFTLSDPAFENRGIPDPLHPNNMLAAFWDDLNVDGGGAIYYKSEPENDRFIVQYDHVIRRATLVPETFQVILYRDGSILYQYADVQETGQCTIGIENAAGDDGLMVVYDQEGYLHDDLAILFEPPVIMATVTPDKGQITPGSSVSAIITFDATGLEPGLHVAAMAITSTDPEVSELLVPLLLTVTDVSAAPETGIPGAVTFIGAAPNPFNPATSLKFSLPVGADVKLTIYDVSGRRVRSLVTGRLKAGHHEASWNGRDDAGRNVASGTYFARLTVGGLSSVKSVTLIR